MFREMRRKNQLLSFEECVDILNNGTSGVLAVSGDDNYPYAVPISYAYDDDKIYFHCAKEGHKIDSVKRNSKASFCVIGQDEIIPEKYTTGFRSIIAFGKIRVLEDDNEKRDAIEKLAVKYAPNDNENNRRNAIEKDYGRLCMLEFSIEHMTGKEGIELVRAKKTGV